MKRKSARKPKAKVMGVKEEAVAVEAEGRVKSHEGCNILWTYYEADPISVQKERPAPHSHTRLPPIPIS